MCWRHIQQLKQYCSPCLQPTSNNAATLDLFTTLKSGEVAPINISVGPPCTPALPHVNGDQCSMTTIYQSVQHLSIDVTFMLTNPHLLLRPLLRVITVSVKPVPILCSVKVSLKGTNHTGSRSSTRISIVQVGYRVCTRSSIMTAKHASHLAK
jgi:hypothetical protein